MRISFTSEIEDEAVQNAIERKIRLALTRYSPRVRQLVVTLADNPTPPKGVEIQCCIAVHFRDGSRVMATGKAHEVTEAGAEAAHRASRVIRRRLDHPTNAY